MLVILTEGPVIPETICSQMKAEGMQTVLTSIRLRCSELARMGLIYSGRRGRGGYSAIAWRVTTYEAAGGRSWLIPSLWSPSA